MIQLILHLTGDYLFQTDWMAKNKKADGFNGILACLSHCLIYSLPFLFIGSVPQVNIIFFSHYLIDRTQIVKSYMQVFGQKEFAKPPFAPWSIIVIDNTFHLICNYIALTYFL